MASIAPDEINRRIGTIHGELPCRGVKHTLSVCMIVKNEEANIDRAIRSFLPFADEIIVNDTGSTDRTLEILATFPIVKVIHSEWIGDFSYSRNLSLDAATCSWCLWMDADDYVPPDQVENFRRLKHAPLDRAFGFQIINTQSGGMPWGAHFMQVRMFPNHPQIRFERRVHEQILFGVAQMRLHLFYLETTIWHMGYEELAQRQSKSLRNLELLKNEPDRGADPVISTQLGDGYSILERWDEAIAAYKEVLDIPNVQAINIDAYHEVFIALGKCYQGKGEREEALKWFIQAVAQTPDRIDPLYFQAETLYLLQRYAEAEPLFLKVLQMKRSHSSQASHWDVVRMYSYKYLCDIYTSSRDAHKVLEWATKFNAEYPQVIEAPLFMGKAYLSLENPVQAIVYLEQALAANATANRDAWFALMLAYEKSGASEQIVQVRRRMAEAYGESNLDTATQLLSIAMIVKNEEAHLGACLNSIRGLWDDLVIVDTGSTDATVQIAKDAGARVFHFPWIGDFSAARNRSLEQCEGKWILWLDADDVVPAESRLQIQQMLATASPHKAYGFLIKNSQDAGITGPVFNQVRLFPNRKEIRFTGRVHEQVTPALQSLSIPIEFLETRIVHTGYTDPETIRQKQRRNYELMLKDIEINPRGVNAMKLFALGNALLDLGDFAQATSWYRKSMEQSERVGEDRHILEVIPIKLAECRGNQGFQGDALEMMNHYLLASPVQPSAVYLRAQLEESLGKVEDAARDFGYLMHFQEQLTLMPVDYQQIRIRSCKFLADFWVKRGQQQLALEILRIGVAVGKGQVVSGLKLASLYFESEQYAACRDSLLFARRLDESATALYSLGQVLIMLNDIPGALEALNAGVTKFPGDSSLQHLLTDLKSDLGLE